MTSKSAKTPREALLNETLLGFHADPQAARKLAATTSGKGYTRDRLIANSEAGVDQNIAVTATK